MEEVEIVKMPSETENARERAEEVNEIEDDLEKEMLPVGRETFEFQEEVEKTKPDRDTTDEEIKNTDIIVSSENDEIELSEENFVTPLRCSSRLKHQAVGIEITNSVHTSSKKASKAARAQEVKTKQALEDSEIDHMKEVVETHIGTDVEEGIESVTITPEMSTSENLISVLNNDVEDEGNVDTAHLEKLITDNRNIIEMENKIEDRSQPEIKRNHAEIEAEEQEKEPVSAKAFQTSEETTPVLKLPKVSLMYADVNKEAQEPSVSQKDVDLEVHMSESSQNRNKGKEFEVEPSEKEQYIEMKHGKAVEIIKERVEITKADLNPAGEDTAEKESVVVIGKLEEETTDANKSRDNVSKSTSMLGLNEVAVVLVDFQRQTGGNETDGNEPSQSQDVALLTKANEEKALVEMDATRHVTEKIQHEAAVEPGTNNTLITNDEQDLKEKSTLSGLDKTKSLKDFAESTTPAQCDRVQESNQDEGISVYTSRNPSPRALPVNSTPKRKSRRIYKETNLNENTEEKISDEEVDPVFIKHLRTRIVTVTPKKRPKHVTGTQAAETETEGKVGHEIVTVQSVEEVKTAVEEMHETSPECDVEEVPAVSESVGKDQPQNKTISENDAEEAPDGGRDLVEKIVDDKVVKTTDREIVVEGDLHMRTMENAEPDELNQGHIRSADSEQKIALEDETLFEKSFEEEPSKREKEKSREEEKGNVNISISEEVLDQSEEDVGVEKRALRKRTLTIKDTSRRKSKRLRQQGQGENDSPTQLSVSLNETRRSRASRARGDSLTCQSETITTNRSEDPGCQHPARYQIGTGEVSELTPRNEMKPVFNIEQSEPEEVRGLPDRIVSAKTGSDIIERLMEKKQREHNEAVIHLQRDLVALTVWFESLLRETGEDFLLKISEYDEEVERLMQKAEHVGDLEAFSYQDLHELWNSVSHVTTMKRNCIQELDKLFVKYELERAAKITALLQNHTMKLEKISYVMPSGVHRLINNEAMMINQALLANRQAMTQLHLNLLEKDLQKEVLYHQKWQTKLQEWKKMKVADAVSQFKDFMNSPEIQNPKNVQDTLNTMRTKQEAYKEQRLKILEEVRNMIPPNCSKSSAADWFSSLSAVNEQIDCMHTETITKLREYYENNWQDCYLEVERFKKEVSKCGITPDEIQDIVNSEMVPLIGKRQTQAEESLTAMEEAFEGLAKTAAPISKSLFKFVHGAANVWEVHCAGLQRTEQQLQDCLDEVSKTYEEKNQKNEAQLDILMDKLRQESTEEDLKATLAQILNQLEEIKKGCVNFYKEGVDTVDTYPVMVLKEVHTYSIEVSQYFNVNEIYSQNPEELQQLYPSLTLEGASTNMSPSVNICPDAFQELTPQAHTPDLAHAEEFRGSQNNETFTTEKGNIYSFPVMQCDDDAEGHLNAMEVEMVLYPKSLIAELHRDVRRNFFNHLEERNQEVLNHSVAIMETKKEKLKSELDLRLHLHQPRAKRIEMDIYNVRAAELVLHQDRVDRHCQGILQALSDFRNDFNNLQVTQRKINEEFRTKICNMEDALYSATKSDTLVKLGASIQIILTEHINDIQESQWQFRRNLEKGFKGIREANAQLKKHFKLFAEGGNFTPKEITQYRKSLEKVTKLVDSADEALMLDMQGTESKCLRQGKDVINKFEEKLKFMKVELRFLEKIQSALRNTRIQIKSEVMKSNTQKKMIATVMSELKEKLEAYTQQRSLDKRVTSGDIFGLITSLKEELRKRCQYLDCYLDPAVAVPQPDKPLQGPAAVASCLRAHKQEKVDGSASDPLLQPSHMGASFMNDKAIEVIRGLLRPTFRSSKPPISQHVNEDLKEKKSVTVKARGKASSRPGSRTEPGLSCLEAQHGKSTDFWFDKRFQVFGPKPECRQQILTFKGLITNILWEGNELLLHVAQDFYNKKDHAISRPQHIQQSFDLCADDLNKKLLVYQSHSREYHHDCVQEFCKQLKAVEEILCTIPEALLTKLRDQHLEDLRRSLTLIRQQIKETQQQSEQKRRKHSSQLSVRLSHPCCEEELNRLVTAEDDRQEEQRKAIQDTRLELQACIKRNADDFVTSLATSTEKLLCQLDKILTIDEIQDGVVEPKQENFTKLVRQKQTGILPEEHKTRPLLEKGTSVWPGVGYIEYTVSLSVTQQKQETATITTVKTTKAHLNVIEVRDTLHQSTKLSSLRPTGQLAAPGSNEGPVAQRTMLSSMRPNSKAKTVILQRRARIPLL
ncbi:coiled-coil domain-containing protein, partial [Clarias magur]